MPLKLILLLVAVAMARPDWLGPEGSTAADGSSVAPSHEGGFFRLGILGVPGASTETQLSDRSNVSLPNAAPVLRIQWGWSIIPRLALHADLLNYELSFGKGGFTSFTWGPGATWYTKENFFITGAYGVSLVQQYGNLHGQGIRWSIGGGKEFKVSDYSGLGMMATWEYGSWEDSDSHQKWRMNGLALQLTWTYN